MTDDLKMDVKLYVIFTQHVYLNYNFHISCYQDIHKPNFPMILRNVSPVPNRTAVSLQAQLRSWQHPEI